MAMVIGGVEYQCKGHIGHIDSPIGCHSSFVAFHRQVPPYVVAKTRMIQIEQQGNY